MAVVRHALGSVLIARGARSAPVSARPKFELFTGDTVRTGGDAWTLLSFRNGSNLLLGQGAEVVIEDLDPPTPWFAFLGPVPKKGARGTFGLRTRGVSASLEEGPCDFQAYADPETGRSVWDVLDGRLVLVDGFGRRVAVERGQRALVDADGRVLGPVPFPPTLSRAYSPRAPARLGAEALSPPRRAAVEVPLPPLLTGPVAEASPPTVSTAAARAEEFPPVPDLDVLETIFNGVPWSD